MSTNERWERTILSDLDHEHLVAEVNFDGKFLFLLDREDGRDAVCISLPDKDGKLTVRISLADFIAQLNSAAIDLCR